MSDYLQIARAYLRGTTVVVWYVLFLLLLVASAFEGELAHNQATFGDVLSSKSYMAMFTYFNACLLGVLLGDNIAHPWASVMPHYRKKHLVVTSLIALLFLGMPMLSLALVGTSDIAPTSVAMIFLTCSAAGLWTLYHPIVGGVLALPFLIFVMASPSSSPALAAFLAGTTPISSTILIAISLITIAAFAWRLLTLNEDKLEYANARIWGDLLCGRRQITASSQSRSPPVSLLHRLTDERSMRTPMRWKER